MNHSSSIIQRVAVAAAAGFVAAIASGANAAPPPVGLKVYLQPWDPRTDDDSVQVLFDSGNAISVALADAWRESKPQLLDVLAKTLQTPNLLAKDVTLYKLKVNLNDPELRLLPARGDTLQAVLTTSDAYFEATATQPTLLGRYADARCSVRFTLDLSLAIAFSDDKAHLMRSAFGSDDRPVTVRDFKADSQNLSCDIAKAALSTVGLWQKVTRAINDPSRPEYAQLNNALRKQLDAALARVNAQLKIPAQFARLKVWPDSTKPTVLFGVRNPPLPARTASIRGRLTVGEVKDLALPIDRCDQLVFSAQVKTGPRPLLSSNGVDFGDAPMLRHIGRLSGGALPAGFVNRVTNQVQPGTRSGAHCDYELDGLVPVFPNFVEFKAPGRVPDPHSANPNLRDVIVVEADGWRFDQALHPQPQIDARNLTLRAELRGSAGYREKVDARAKIDPGDPMRGRTEALSDPAAKVTLNPQPLPPKPRPDIGAWGAMAKDKPAAVLPPEAPTQRKPPDSAFGR